MWRRIVLLGILVGLWAVPASALAQGPVGPLHSDPAWHASYWNNVDLAGPPVLERSEGSLDHQWGPGSPDPAVQADHFSARWSRYLDLDAGTYRFTATSDDGLRVYLNGQRIIDQWYDHAAETVSVDRGLSGGHHLVVVEFYEKMGDAVARLRWAPVAVVQNWRGEYYANDALRGAPALVRDDGEIDFRWGAGSPVPGTVGPDRFSVRWTRILSLPADTYRFSMTVDDGGRLWVNKHLLIDAWYDQPPRTYTGTMYVPKGGVPVTMEYYENTGSATAQLSWSPSEGSTGTVVVDNGDGGFAKGGLVSAWRSAAEGYDGDMLWTKNNDRVRPNYNWVRWFPKLSARRYEVLVFIPDRYSTTAKARYWVSHADGYTLRVVNQASHGGKWVSLGTYQFQGNSRDYVSLADVTYERYLSRLIAFDAVKWVPR